MKEKDFYHMVVARQVLIMVLVIMAMTLLLVRIDHHQRYSNGTPHATVLDQ